MLTISIHSRDLALWPSEIGCWPVVWAPIEMVFVMLFVMMLAPGEDWAALLFMSLFLLIWTSAGCYGSFWALWRLAGEEIVEVTGQSVTVSYKLFGLGSPEKYQAEHIWGLRVPATTTAYDNEPKGNWLEVLSDGMSPPKGEWGRDGWYGIRNREQPVGDPLGKQGFNMGQIVFNYDKDFQMIRFGNNIDKAEAQQIIAEIQQRFPQYRDKPILT